MTSAPLPQNEGEDSLRETLKRCSLETIEAAIRYRQTKDAGLLPQIILGIIARFVDPSQRPDLMEAEDDLSFIDDLGIDSLTMMEAVILVEESLDITISNEELRYLRTVGDLKIFIDCKARGVTPPAPSQSLAIENIVEVMPQQPPFLFLQSAMVGQTWASGRYLVNGSDFFLDGHFKDRPVVPASIMLEALGQLGVLFLLQSRNPQLSAKVDPTQIYFTGAEGLRCLRICRPGDLLKLHIKPKRIRHPLATFTGSIVVGKEKAVTAEEITLGFDFLPATSDAPPGGGEQAAEVTT